MTLHNLPAHAPCQELMDAVAHALPALDQPWQRLVGGRVNALWRVGNTVIKQFQNAGGSPLFPNDAAAEATALSLLAPHGMAPKLLAQGQHWLAYQYCPGSPWQSGTAQIADALTRLHRIPAPVAMFRAGANGSAQLLRQAQAIAALCSAALPPPPSDSGIPPGPACLIHGDVVPGNLIAHSGKITLIDWQCPAIGDPTEDVATFLSPAMQSLYRGAPLTVEEVSAFRAACPPHIMNRYDQLAEIYHWRMAAHCQWKAEQNAPDYAQAMQLELAALQRLAQQHPG